MNKINVQTQTLIHPDDAGFDLSNLQPSLKASRRLLVLVPINFDYTTVIKRIREVAQATGSVVHLMGLCNDAEQEMALRRDLITMSALIRSASISVSITAETGTDWIETVRHTYQSGDMIVCMDGQRTGLLRRHLSRILESTLQSPIYVLSELHPSKSQPVSGRLSQVLAWFGSLAIVVGFFILQVKIHQAANQWITIMELLSTAVEFWLIWVWNSLLG